MTADRLADAGATAQPARVARRGTGPVRRSWRWGWASLGALVFAACLVPAALNGYPTTFGDTLGYLHAARDFRPTQERAFGYAVFLRLTGGLLSFWLPVVAQSALAAYVAVRWLALEAPAWPARWRASLLGAFTAALLAGHLPWEASFVMPDLFSGVMLLALLLLAEHWVRLPAWERLAGATLLLASATMHLTHLPLLLGLGVVAAGAGVLAPRMVRGVPAAALRPARRAAVLSLAAAALGWASLAGANYVTFGEATTSRGGSVFLFARLQADTDAARILQPICDARAAYAICGQLDRLRAEHPDADQFLWGLGGGTPMLPSLGWVPGFLAEARMLNPILLRYAWRDWLAASAERVPHQLTTFTPGDGMDEFSMDTVPDALVQQGLPAIAVEVSASRQATDRLLPLLPLWPARTLGAAGLLALVGLAAFGTTRNRPEVWWPASLFLAAWIGNAALIALGGEVHARYGARIVWIAPLLAGALAVRAVRPPHREEAVPRGSVPQGA